MIFQVFCLIHKSFTNLNTDTFRLNETEVKKMDSRSPLYLVVILSVSESFPGNIRVVSDHHVLSNCQHEVVIPTNELCSKKMNKQTKIRKENN